MTDAERIVAGFAERLAARRAALDWGVGDAPDAAIDADAPEASADPDFGADCSGSERADATRILSDRARVRCRLDYVCSLCGGLIAAGDDARVISTRMPDRSLYSERRCADGCSARGRLSVETDWRNELTSGLREAQR